MATVLTGGSVRARTGGGMGSPTTRKRSPINTVYGMTVPRSATATGPHGVYPGTGHVAKLTRITHPAAVRQAPTKPGHKPPKAMRPKPPARNRPGRQPLPPKVAPPVKGVGGTVIEVGGFVQQENAGGTTSGVGGGSAARAATGGYFTGLADAGGIGGVSWAHLAEGAAVVFAGALLWRATAKKGRR